MGEVVTPRMKRTGVAISCVALGLLVACGGDTTGGGDTNAGAPDADSQRRAAGIAVAAAESADAARAPVPLLRGDERSDLRRHLNPTHLASARALGIGGIEDSSNVDRLVAQGKLMRLPDSTRYWTVRELEHSLPFVTPDAHAMLVDIGERFQTRLDSLGIPHYRFEVSSVLRTAALQEDLRRGNRNASRSTSSHEFGTTVDIPYNTFVPPVTPMAGAAIGDELRADPSLAPIVRPHLELALAEVAEERRAELKAILGRVLIEMQDEGALRGLHERGQAVYHITVAQEYPQTEAGAVR